MFRIGFRIPLVRQNWPREAAMHFEMANDKGPLPAFLRPKPPKPITNATVALYRYLDVILTFILGNRLFL